VKKLPRASGLEALATVKQALAERERLAAERARQEAAAQHERELFTRHVGPVRPLRAVHRAPITRPRPEPIPQQRLRDEAAALAESISDELDVETLLETDEALSFRRRGIGPEVVRKLRRGVWAIQAHCDLHGLRRDEARERLAAFLRDAAAAGARCVRVVHGKGNGSPGRVPVLKTKVRAWLVQRQEVIAFAQARAADGGHGAMVVLLRA
jgi:DNA-nicking Smr family endonuclease